MPRPSPSPQSTTSPARAASITSSGATTFLLSDATAATSQPMLQGTGAWCAAVLLSTSDASVLLGLQPPTAPEASTRNQDLEVKVGKLVLTRKADPALRGASK